MDDNNERTGLEIAVIGMAGRFPGAGNIDEFWKNLKNGVESISFLTDEEIEELDISQQLLDNPKYIRVKGGVLEDADCFDAAFFGYLPAEAELMDPQMRLFHECAWEALEDAGYDPDEYDGSIGLYGGAADNFYWEALTVMAGSNDMVDSFSRAQLNDKDFLTTRVSFKLNLKGPAVTMHTACSTSLVAVDLACRGLLSGGSDIALAGGTAVSPGEKRGIVHQEGTITTTDGHCRAFDAKASGTIFGEGVGMVVLKRLDEAIEDGDFIYCLVKGFAVNNDGIRKAGFTAPSIEGQAEVIRAAQQMAEVPAESIGYIETHGTGTILGDPVEIEGLKLAFNTEKRNYCAVGSVKPNIGHLDTAAGAAGFIKTALALKHRLIPPNINFESPNPAIDFENSPFYVNTELREWKNDRYPHLLRAGVSSFGVGGTNAHVVLEEAPEPEAPSPSPGRRGQLILLSAKTKTALDGVTENAARFLNNTPGLNLPDAAYTWQRGRRAFSHRKILVCSSAEEAANALSSGDPRKVKSSRLKEKMSDRYVVFMFSGQGAQYVDMGLGLYRTEPVFREEMDRCFEILKPLSDCDIKNILYPHPGVENKFNGSEKTYSEKINRTEFAQPLLFALEYSLAKLLMAWGIKPRAMIGHSIGEYTAACLAGVFPLESALRLVVLRGRLMQKMPGGSMLSVPLPEETLIPLLAEAKEDISPAAVNGPSRCVVSGPHAAIETFEKRLMDLGHKCTRLHTSHAFHSAMMDPLLPEFEEAVKQIELSRPGLPYLSNVTGNWIKDEEARSPSYWAGHIRKTVRFSDGVTRLLEKENPLFIEVGPGKALSTLVRDNKDKEKTFITNVVRHPGEEVDDDLYFLEKIGLLWLRGIKIDWGAYYANETRRRTPLPTYPFERKRYRIEGDPYKIGAGRLGAKTTLERRPDMADWFYAPLWEGALLPDSADQADRPPGVNRENEHWLVFIDETGLGNRLIRRLEQVGRHVTTVRKGTEYKKEKDSPYTYIVNPGFTCSYDSLFRELRDGKRVPQNILHLWNVNGNVNGTRGETTGSRLDGLDESQDAGLHSLLNIVRAAGKEAVTGEIRVSVVTDNMQRVTGEEITVPEKATILGAVKVIPLEYVNITCRSIDIVLPPPGSPLETKLENMLMEELNTGISHKVIAYRGPNRWVPVLKPHRLGPTAKQTSRLKENGVYLVTGGFGGMGFTLAEYLASTFKARLILVGRSFFPPREKWGEWLNNHEPEDRTSLRIRKIRDMEAQGAEVTAVSADISDYDRMAGVIAGAKERFGPINGVIHTAGLADYGGVIQKRTRETTETVTAPKVKGTLVLDALLRDEPLDFFVLFSSIGNFLYKVKFGEVSYVAGNEFLDAFAHYKATAGGKWKFTASINWTDWLEVGMSVDALKQRLGKNTENIDYDAHFFDAVTPAEGVAVFERFLANKHHHLAIGAKDLKSMIEFLDRVKGKESSPDGPGDTGETTSEKALYERPELSTDYVAPRDKTERELVALFQHYFGFEKVGIYDDFFELGGDSLKALTVASRIHQMLNVEITLPVFFAGPTIASLTEYVNNTQKSEFSTVTPAEKKEYYPLSSAQTRFYILQQIEADNTLYNMPKIIALGEGFGRDQLEETFNALIRRHESLRTSFAVIDGTPVQIIKKTVPFETEFYDLNAGGDLTGTGIKTLFENFVRPFELSRAPLLRARLIRTVENSFFLLVDMHHMISDKFALIVLERDFQTLCNGEKLPPLTLQYKDFAQWESRMRQSDRLKRQGDYWREEFQGKLPVLSLPTDFARPETQGFEGHTINFRIGSEKTAVLKEIAREQDATLFMVLLALECVWLSKLSGQEDIVIGAPLAGRNHPDLEKMIGIFLKTLALRNFPNGWKTFNDFLAEVRDRTLNAFENQDYCFEDLVDTLDIPRDISRNPLFDAAINFYGFEGVKTPPPAGDNTRTASDSADSGLDRILDKYGSDIAHNDLMLYVTQDGDELDLSLEYWTKLFKRETIERFINHFNHIIACVIENKTIKLEDIKISHELIKSESEVLEEDLEDFDF